MISLHAFREKSASDFLYKILIAILLCNRFSIIIVYKSLSDYHYHLCICLQCNTWLWGDIADRARSLLEPPHSQAEFEWVI